MPKNLADLRLAAKNTAFKNGHTYRTIADSIGCNRATLIYALSNAAKSSKILPALDAWFKANGYWPDFDASIPASTPEYSAALIAEISTTMAAALAALEASAMLPELNRLNALMEYLDPLTKSIKGRVGELKKEKRPAK